MLYQRVHDNEYPSEISSSPEDSYCSSEFIGFYDLVDRLMSLALRYGAALEKVGDRLAGSKFVPCGTVVGHVCIKHCSSLPDLTFDTCW